MMEMKSKSKKPHPGCCLVSNIFHHHRIRRSLSTKNADLKADDPPKSIATPNSFEFKQTAEIEKASNNQKNLAKNQQGSSSKKKKIIRATSSNLMFFGNLGNFKGRRRNSEAAFDVLDYLPKTAKELSLEASEDHLDGDKLKEMGNEEYKKGRYSEAVTLYDRAIAKDQKKAAYWSNKAAALIGLGQILEAVEACIEAVRIDPCYYRAHYRLATLYIRLGDADKAIEHYNLAKNEASSEQISRVDALQTCVAMAKEAQKLKDWTALIKLTQSAVSAGADSAPQIFASQTEALLNLNRHEEADAVLENSPKFDIDALTKFFGPAVNSYLLSIRAQVALASGRFEDAVTSAQKAVSLDPNNENICSLAQKTLAVSTARSKGNELFKASKFEEASNAYGDGLRHDPNNAILLCNRAAAQCKLGKCENAIEDCNISLIFRPSYNKARLRRAECNAKLERWEASMQEYEVLLREMPGDEEVVKALFEAHLQLKKQSVEGMKDSETDGEFLLVKTEEQFRNMVTQPGLSVALFFNKSSESSEQQTFHFKDQLFKQFPSVRFFKVDIQGSPFISKSEHTSTVPGFRIYRNGSYVKEIAASDWNQLEICIKSFST